MRRLWTLTFLVLLMTVLYLSLRPSPAVATVPLIPPWWGRWLDGHDVVKNAIGFGALGFAGLMAVRARAGRRKEGGRRRKWTEDGGRRAEGGGRSVLRMTEGRLLVGLGLLIVGLELAQLGTQYRQTHWRDVVVGWAALGAAYGVVRARSALPLIRDAR